MPTFKWSELERAAVDPEHSSATGSVFRGERIEVALVLFPAGTGVKPHASPHEQVQSILKGQARYRVDREEKVVGPGEAVLIGPNVPYAVEILDELEVVAFRDVQPAAGAGRTGARATAFFTWDEMASDFITPKYSSARGPTLTGERIEVAFMFFPAGTEGKLHSHPNEQIQVALSGKAVGVIEGGEHLIEPGGGILFPANVTHGARILADYTVINCKDIVPGWSVYHARWER